MLIIYTLKKRRSSNWYLFNISNPRLRKNNVHFLGIAGKINEKDVDVKAVSKSEITFLEGYLWDKGDPKKAFDKAIDNANKIAMSLSDKFCVDRHKSHFLELVKNKLDITFANEQEITSLIDAKNFNDVIEFGKKIKKIINHNKRTKWCCVHKRRRNY